MDSIEAARASLRQRAAEQRIRDDVGQRIAADMADLKTAAVLRVHNLHSYRRAVLKDDVSPVAIAAGIR